MRHISNVTKWVPILGTTLLSILGTLMGSTLLPIHVTVMPSHGIKDISLIHLNPTYLTPIEKNNGKERLRACHTICDSWNDLFSKLTGEYFFRLCKKIEEECKRD